MFLKLYNLYKENYHFLYIAVLSIFVASMPHSRGILSSSQIGLAILWFLDVNFKHKITNLKHNKALLIFLSIFFMHILGLIYTDNFSYALNDLKIKLPLLLLPLVIATSKKLTFKEIKLLITIFSVSVFLKTLYGLSILLGLTDKEIEIIQEIAGKFSHIRYALMLNIIIFTNLYFLLIHSEKDKKIVYKILRLLLVLWMSIFLFILHSITGWVVFFVLIIFTGIFLLKNSNSKLLKLGLFLSFGITGTIVLFLAYSINKFYTTDKIDISKIEKITLSGNNYAHNFTSKNRENGHFVDIYICEEELIETWESISNFKYWEKDKRNQIVKYTLIRYLASKNLKKDKEGVLKLTKQDILNVENGLANYIYEDKLSIYPKIYEVLWQLDKYLKGGNPEKHSVTQRFEFFKVGKKIVKNNFFIGVGTGDVGDVFKNEYKNSSTQLSKDYRLRAHNQYLTFFITFGIIGFIWFLFAYIYPAILEKKFNDYLFLIVFIIMSLSMLNEDALETQMGVTIFAFFISLFLFGYSSKNKHKV